MKYLIDFTALALLYAFVFFGKWKIKGKDILLVNTLMYIYLSFMLYFTLMPIITSVLFVLNHPYVPMNLVPFIDVLTGRGDFFRQIVLNIIMTMPFGFLFPLTRNRTAKFSRTVFFCFLMSLGIEILQPLINGFRSSDITDIITNVIGGMLGYGFYVIFRPVTFWVLNRLKTRNRVIFLDIDGVLNSSFWNDSHQREISEGTLVDAGKVKLLSMLVKRTNARIILHSGWKYWFDKDLKPLRPEAESLVMLFKKEELLLEDITPDHSTEEIRRNKKFSLVKASEILVWLTEHEDVDNWVVIDDLDLHNKEIEMHQVKTDPSIGLTIDDVYKAQTMLLNE